jgi:hypothetical protein
MQIDAISKVSNSTPNRAAPPPPSKPPTSPKSAANPRPTDPASSSSAATSAAPSASAQTSNLSGAKVSTLAVSYSATVAGESYAESVVKTGDTYVASIPSPPGGSASGSSVQAAENNLNIKLDTLA